MEENKDENLEEKVNEEEKVKTEEIKNEKVEEVKNEAKETIKQVKEQMKDVNFKEEAKNTKGFIIDLIKEPISKIKEIANDSSNNFFKIALIILAVWTVVYFFNVVSFSALKYVSFGTGFWTIIRGIITPALSLAALSVIIFLFNYKSGSKKSLITIVTTLITVRIPYIIALIFNLITLISSKAIDITSRVGNLAEIISAVLLYFAIKGLLGIEDDKKAFIKFAIIYAIYMAVSLVLGFLQINI